MCGIHGVLLPRADVADAVRRMHEALKHRGPDDDAILTLESAVFGHRRLSIVDLSPTGAQPMWSSGRELCITYNGEIYNAPALRNECLAAGIPFNSTCDTEVILNQFLLRGREAFDRLNGMFAFCLADLRSGEFWLVRDHAGIKPLFYGVAPTGLYFASELDALLASRAFPLEIDDVGLHAYLQTDSVPAPRTIVRNIHKLAGGSVLRIAHDGTIEQRALTKTHAHATAAASIREPVKTFDALIRDVIRRQMIADVPVGVFLSGGVDSSIVALVASEVAGKPLPMFSVAFEDRSFDERPFFELLGRQLGAEHHVELFTAKAALDLVPDLASLAREPLGDASILPTYAISRFAGERVKVVLSGDGADELFAGYPTHRLWRAGTRYAHLPAAVRRLLAGVAHGVLPVNFDNLSIDYRIKKFLSGADQDPLKQNRAWLGTFSEAELTRLLPHTTRQTAADADSLLRGPDEGLPSTEQILRMDQRFYLQEQVLVKVDRASMAASLEVRVPFLDDEMIAFARGLPAAMKIRGAESKHILRNWLRSRVPREIWRRPKKGFGVPLGHWFRGPLREMLVESLAVLDGIVDRTVVSGYVEEHTRGKRDRRKELFNLLALALWYRRARSIASTEARQHLP